VGNPLKASSISSLASLIAIALDNTSWAREGVVLVSEVLRMVLIW